MTVTLIAAMGRNRVIGRDGGLPWKLPDDMKFFMRTTSGHTVVMGRRTWESFDGALPKRRNIVITRQADYDAPGAEVVSSLDEALALCRDDGEVYIMGGGEIYTLALPKADRLVLTHVECDVEGDACFPAFDENDWRITHREKHEADDRHAYAFEFVTYDRR